MVAECLKKEETMSLGKNRLNAEISELRFLCYKNTDEGQQDQNVRIDPRPPLRCCSHCRSE